MSKAVQMSMIVPGILLFVFIFAMMPIVLQAGPIDGSLHFSWGQGFQSLKEYIAGVGSGDSFRFYSGKNEYLFWERIGYYFPTSFYYVVTTGILSVTIGIFIGIYFAVSGARWVRSIVDLVGALPEFVVILLLQFVIVLIAKQTGVVVFKVGTLTSEDPAIVLPLIAMVVMPTNYMIRNVALQMKLTLKEEYIGNAKARGLGKVYIIFYHALPNVLPYMKSDLHKLMGIVMGNLFIMEYLFNNKGVSMLIFANAFVGRSYQYDIVVNGLLAFLVLYSIGYTILRAYLYMIEKVFLR